VLVPITTFSAGVELVPWDGISARALERERGGKGTLWWCLILERHWACERRLSCSLFDAVMGVSLHKTCNDDTHYAELTFPLLQWIKTGCWDWSFKTSMTLATFSREFTRFASLCAMIPILRWLMPFELTNWMLSGAYGSSTRVLPRVSKTFPGSR